MQQSQPSRPRDFDWVSARHACSLTAQFETLRALAERDVELRNGLGDRPAAGSFSLHSHDANIFSVVREHDAYTRVIVRFKRTADVVEIEQFGHESRRIDLTITLTDDGECKLLHNGKELDPWQVLRAALAPLFFQPIP